MHVDFIIVGQGISGTMLSWFLYREGKSFLVIDDNNQNASTKIAAGIINPVTGRRYAYTWMIDEIMPFAIQAYKELEAYFNINLVNEKSIIDFFPSPQMLNAFVDRVKENDTYLHSFPDQNHFNQYFNYDFGCGEIRPAYMVNLKQLLESWRSKLIEMNCLLQDGLLLKELKIEDDLVSYGNVHAKKIIFCEGANGVGNAWFELLPFAPNKGEALVIQCDDLMTSFIFKRGLMLAPMAEENLYWVGSNYQWEFKDDQPSRHFYDHSVSLLNNWLRKPYRVLSHKAAVRPATLERRPFVGFHPVHANVGILNGMGTKGSSLAPFFAYQLVQNMIYNFPITPEADVNRFSRILRKTNGH